MTRKTFHCDRDGIRVEGHVSKTAALKAWIATRDAFAKVAAECRPWVFARAGHVLTVAPQPYWWEYTIVRPDSDGVINATCYFGAESQVKAIAAGLGALAHNVWARECPDDAAMFDDMVRAACMLPSELTYEREQFLRDVEFCRAHAIAETA